MDTKEKRKAKLLLYTRVYRILNKNLIAYRKAEFSSQYAIGHCFSEHFLLQNLDLTE